MIDVPHPSAYIASRSEHGKVVHAAVVLSYDGDKANILIPQDGFTRSLPLTVDKANLDESLLHHLAPATEWICTELSRLTCRAVDPSS